MQVRSSLAAFPLLAAMLAAPHAACAAQSYANCTGYIDALPATISSGGTWCLRKDLATGIASGSAIQIAADDVTIDCNDFKIGGLAAGNGSNAYGIASIPQPYTHSRNIVVRNCNVRGFSYGIVLYSSIGSLIEDNRLDNNLTTGIDVNGSEHTVVRRNAVYDTGGQAASTQNGLDASGIQGSGDMIDNIVDGVFSSGDYGDVRGLWPSGTSPVIRGNRIGGLVRPGTYGMTYGIDAISAAGATVAGNNITSPVAVDALHGGGIRGSMYCSGNTVANFTDSFTDCHDDGGNVAY